MKIDSSFAGTRLKKYTRKIHWRDTTNYAAALNDDNDLYFDDHQFDQLLAHPMYSAAITWPVVERIWEFIESDDFPMAVLATQVHYSEHIQYYRLVSPGDRLHIHGQIAAILPHRAGTQVVIRFDVTDENDQLVFVEHIGSILRGVQCMGKGKGEETLPRILQNSSMPDKKYRDKSDKEYQEKPDKKFRDKTVWESGIFINRLQPFIYDGCSDIVFPIHTSKKFAHQVGLPDIILQGTATLGYAIRELINREAGRNPSQINSLYARFSGMVIPGTEIKVILNEKIFSKDCKNLYFCVKNHRGDIVIKDGFAEFFVDSDCVK